MVKRFLVILILLLSGLLGFIVSHHSSQSMAVANFHNPVSFVEQLKSDPNPGERIFKQFCANCHDKQPQIPVHAPRIGDKTAWQPFEPLGMVALLHMASQGTGAMPPRGGCFECSDQQLRMAIEFILSKSR